MPRPILGTHQTTVPDLGQRSASASRAGLSAPKLQQRLRQLRSKPWLDAVARLDAGVHTGNQSALAELVDAIASEFPELGIDQRPLGIVGRCYLGAPYEVHMCDLTGSIIEHFERNRSMPALYERARALALHPSYVFIEVYADAIRAISADGSVAVVDVK